MQHLLNFCKMRHHMRAHRHVLSSKLAWTYRQTRSHGGTVEHRRPLVTLDPEKLSSLNYFPRDISSTQEVSYTVGTRHTFLRGVSIRYTTLGRRYLPFPNNTRGFLYYQSPKPGNPDFSGSLRFRVVSEQGPNSFAQGVDLKLPSGNPWQIHLYTAVTTLRHAGLVFKLLEDGLITSSVVEKIRALPPMVLQATSQFLYHLEDPFVARLHNVESLVFMSNEGAEAGAIMPLFFDPRKQVNKHPYEGTVRAHFERSTLPEHAGTRTIVLRILDAPSSVKCVVSDYDYYILPPTSGNLLHGYYLNGKRGARGLLRPWSANLDVGIGKATRMFSLLWPPLSGKDSNATT